MNICEQKQNMKEAFGVYLRKRYDVNINESPYKDISFIDESLKEDLDNDGLYSIDSVKVFDEVINKLKENGRYDELIEKSQEEEANDYSEVLDNYREFLIAYQFAQEWVKPRKTEYEDNKFALNTIVFGAPGTGKSHSINDFIEKNNATWKIQSELTPRANVSLTPENFLILTP